MNRPKNKKVSPKYGIKELISDILIATGIVLLGLPFVWSLRSDNMQNEAMNAAQTPNSAATRPTGGYASRHSLGKPVILIPKLGVRAAIVEEVTEADLDKGPMHLADTAMPGDPGNCCIAAHKEKWFRGLGKLAKGDTVTIKAYGYDFVYTVAGRRIVPCRDLSVLDPTTDPTLTLITCTGPAYFGRGKGRLVVTATLTDTK